MQPCAVLCCTHSLRPNPVLCCAYPLAAGQAWFAGSSQPPGTRDYTTGVSLPLPKSAATSYHVKCFLLDSRNDSWNVFLLRKSYKSSKDQNEVALLWMGSAWHVVPWLDICWCWAAQGFQRVNGCRIVCTILFFFIVLAPTNGILGDTLLQALSAFLNGIIMNQRLLVQNMYVI